MTDSAAETRHELHEELLSVLNAPRFDGARFCMLLDEGIDPNWRNGKGTPLLHLVTQKGAPSAQQHLIDKGADVHATDAAGNTALFEAYQDLLILPLLTAGASPSHKNNDGKTPRIYLPLNHDSFAYRSIVSKSAALLGDCCEIETAAKNGRLSVKTWQELFSPPASHGYAPMPQTSAFAYFLYKMEEDDQFISKDYLASGSQGAEGAKIAIRDSQTATLAWREHCDKAGEPMTAKEWAETGVFESPNKMHGGACLFEPRYWMQQESLEEFCELARHLPESPKTLNAKVPLAMAETLDQWLTQGPGKELDSNGVRQFYRELPPIAREQVKNLHKLVHERELPAQQGHTR